LGGTARKGKAATFDLESDLGKRVEAIKQLLILFRFERAVYLGITVTSLVVLLGCAGYMLYAHGLDSPGLVAGLFGSAGGVTYSTGRLLRMWTEALSVLSGAAGRSRK
jgi:hypothetical protein